MRITTKEMAAHFEGRRVSAYWATERLGQDVLILQHSGVSTYETATEVVYLPLSGIHAELVSIT